MIDDPLEQADSPLDAGDETSDNRSGDRPEDRLDQQLGELLRRTSVAPMPDLIRARLAKAIREAQAEREAGELAQLHRDALLAASKRTALGSFGPNPIHPHTAFRGRWPRARTIGA